MNDQQSFKRILVPVDESNGALRAEEYAASIARRFGSNVTVLHVVSDEIVTLTTEPELPAWGARYRIPVRGYLKQHIPQTRIREIEEIMRQKGSKILREAEEFFRKEGLKVESKLVEDADTANVIIDEIERGEYGLVVMGNHGASGSETPSLGDIAVKVVRYAEAPVLLVKKRPVLERILVAVDGSPNSLRAVDLSRELALKFNSSITLLNVTRADFPRLNYDVARRLGKQILSDAASPLIDVSVEKRVEFGNAADVIVEIANEGNYDLTVVGSRGLSRVKRFLLGSVSDRVSREVNGSVLVVRGPMKV